MITSTAVIERVKDDPRGGPRAKGGFVVLRLTAPDGKSVDFVGADMIVSALEAVIGGNSIKETVCEFRMGALVT